MSIITNHTRPPEGQPDISIHCFYDSDDARRLFDESLEVLQHSSYSEPCLAWYYGGGAAYDAIEWRLEGKPEEMLRYLREQGHEDLDYPRQDCTDYLGQYMRGLDALSWYDQGQISFCNIFVRLGTYDLQIAPYHNGQPITIHYKETRGYCQMDPSAKVWVSATPLTQV